MYNNLKRITRECKDCGKHFEITENEQVFAQKTDTFQLPKRCNECRAERKQLEPITIVCRQCSKEFIFEVGEQKFFRDRGFKNPSKCPVCRKEIKNGSNNGSTENQQK